MDDMELVREYATTGSEEAFATLTERYINLVYSVAIRHVSNPHEAEEVVQAVFIILAKKAHALGPKTVLAGWLFHTARLTAANFLRMERRRMNREQEAYMRSELESNEDNAWEQIAPFLDEAIGSLNEKDRNAIVLRFMEGRNLREVGETIGATEDAAKRRVSRAVDKLRAFFVKRGVVLSAAMVVTAISTSSVQAAPAGLSSTVASTAALKGAAAGSSTLLLTKGTMKVMTWLKIKTAALTTSAALLVVAVTVAVANHSNAQKEIADIIQKSQAKYDSLTSLSCVGTTVANASGKLLTNSYTIKLARPDYYLIEWQQRIYGNIMNTGVVWSAGSGNFLVSSGIKLRKEASRNSTLSTAAGLSGSATHTIPGAFFNEASNIPGSFFKEASNPLASIASLNNLSKKADEAVAGSECYVISGVKNANGKDIKLTYWIGKSDLLIHQVSSVVKGFTTKIPNSNQTLTMDLTATQTFSEVVLNPPLTTNDFLHRQ